VKYNYFHKEQKKKFKENFFHSDNLYYNVEEDYYVCPIGQHMTRIGKGTRVSSLGYESEVIRYQAANCQGCPLRSKCFKGLNNRVIEVNYRLKELKRQARKRLMSVEGEKLRKQRCIEPESVFGHLKSNRKYNRFRMYGLEKIDIDFGLLCIAHNLKKMMKKTLKNKLDKMNIFFNAQINLLKHQFNFVLNNQRVKNLNLSLKN